MLAKPFSSYDFKYSHPELYEQQMLDHLIRDAQEHEDVWAETAKFLQINKRADLKNIESLMSACGIDLVVCDNSDMFKPFFMGEGSGPQACAMGENRFILINNEELSYREIGFGILHEAAHLIVNKYQDGEGQGVGQAELCLASTISPEFLDHLVEKHATEYGWDASTYEEERKTKRWKIGAKTAIEAVLSFDRLREKYEKEIRRAPFTPVKKD